MNPKRLTNIISSISDTEKFEIDLQNITDFTQPIEGLMKRDDQDSPDNGLTDIELRFSESGVSITATQTGDSIHLGLDSDAFDISMGANSLTQTLISKLAFSVPSEVKADVRPVVAAQKNHIAKLTNRSEPEPSPSSEFIEKAKMNHYPPKPKPTQN